MVRTSTSRFNTCFWEFKFSFQFGCHNNSNSNDMEPNFDGYHKIVESSQKWVTDESTNSLIKKTKWVVMEKVHGANFCIIIDGNKTIKCAKRREILPENEDFFGHKRILPELRPKIEKLQELILQNFPDTQHVFVFGEIFGGA